MPQPFRRTAPHGMPSQNYYKYLEAPDADDVNGAWKRSVHEHRQARVLPGELSPHPHGKRVMKELGEHPNLVFRVCFESILRSNKHGNMTLPGKTERQDN